MGKYIDVTDSTFENEIVNSDVPVLVDFWAEWCAPCRMLAPTIEELATEKENVVKVTKVDVDSNPELATKFGIRSIPTLMIFKNGKVVKQLVGVVSKSTIEIELDKVI